MTNAISRDPSYRWTAREIEARLGCSSCVFPRDRLLQAGDIADIRRVGITRVEMFCGDRPPLPLGNLDIHNRSHISEVMSECEKQGVSIVSVHSPKGYPYHSEDENERKHAVAEGVSTAKLAEEMGADVMVCHFGTSPQSEKSVTEMLDQLEGHSIKLGTENGEDLADYTAIVDRIASDRFGMVVDIGHTKDEDGVNPFIKKERARETMNQCGKRLIHVQLHDWVDGDHFSPLDGSIQWGEVFAALKGIDYRGELMFEAALSPETRKHAPDYVLGRIASFPEEFVDRYVSQ